MRWLFIVALIVASQGLCADHAGESSSTPTTTSDRPEAEPTDKSNELFKKISACLDERPAASDTEAPGTAAPGAGGTGNDVVEKTGAGGSTSSSSGSTSGKGGGNGAALFNKYCATCHTAGGSKGPIQSNSVGADRVVKGSMPPKGNPQPSADEKKAIAEYLKTK